MWSPNVSGSALHHAEITFYCSSIIANTEGWDVGIQLVTSDTAVSRGSAEYMQLLADHCGEWTGCNHGLEAAGAGNSAALAAWGTTGADQANIDAGASSIVGINYLINLNAETAGVPLINYAELTCTDISDFTPQQQKFKEEIFNFWNLVQLDASGALGTVIDSMREYSVAPAPFIFDNLPAAKLNVDIADINSLTGLTAGDGVLTLFWK